MRTLTPLILLPLVILAPLLMAPTVRADELKIQVVVNIEGALSLINDPSVNLLVDAEAFGTEGITEGRGHYLIFPSLSSDGRSLSAQLVGEVVQANVVLLSGVVAQSSDPDFLRTPVEVKADGDTGAIAFRLGPVSGGPLAGQILIFAGTGRVTIFRICFEKIVPCKS